MEEMIQVSHGPGAIFCSSSALYFGYHFLTSSTVVAPTDLSR